MDLADFKADYDWRAAFQEAFNGGYRSFHDDDGDIGPIAGVLEILACTPGDNDGPNWLAVVFMADGRYAYVSAGCDYTGWDCRAGGAVEFAHDVNRIVSKITLDDEARDRLGDQLREQQARGRLRLDWEDVL